MSGKSGSLWAITVTDRSGLEDAPCEGYGTMRRTFERLLPNTYDHVKSLIAVGH